MFSKCHVFWFNLINSYLLYCSDSFPPEHRSSPRNPYNVNQSWSMATVYLGAWVNWTDGRILGATLTVTSRAGAYLIAFLALFVRIAGGHLWTITAYLTFLYRSKLHDQDIYYHQQQAVLRNTVTETGAIIGLVKIARHWHGNSYVQQPYGRAAPILLAAATHLAAFFAAGIFSSKVTSARSEVLIRGAVCGTWASRTVDTGYIQRQVRMSGEIRALVSGLARQRFRGPETMYQN